MSKKPLAYRFGMYISSAVLIVYAIFIVWAYQYNFILAEGNAKYKALNINNSLVSPVRQRVIATQEVAANIATEISFYHQYGEAAPFLRGLLEKYPYIWSFRIEMTPRDDLGKPVSLLIPRDDTIHLCAGCGLLPGKCLNDETLLWRGLGRKSPGWSEPFRCENNGLILSVYYYPFATTGETGDTLMTGYVACQLSLEFLGDLINEIPKGEKGFAFLISRSGNFITHPNPGFILNRNLYRLSREVFPDDSATLARKFVQELQPLTVYPEILSYVKSWAYPTLIPENGWIMSFVMPYSEFYRELNRLLLKMILVSIGVAALIFYIVFAISRRLMRPISAISKELHSFSIEKLDPQPGETNEAVLLQESLIRLQKRYEKNLQSEKELSQRRAKLRDDMLLAAEIQKSFIPPAGNHYLHDGGVSLHAVYHPLATVSGDLFDFFMISDHKMLVTIGDVSGAGIPAALFMGVAHTFIKSNAFAGSASEIVDLVNKLLCKNNSNQFFLSLFLGILDLENDTLNYCNAGHTPSFLIHLAGNVRELGDPHGLPLGLYFDRGYKENVVKFSKSDILIMYTDGITEQVNETGELYGVDNFYRIFDKVKNQTTEEVAGMIIGEVNSFAGARSQSDDLCLLVLKYE